MPRPRNFRSAPFRERVHVDDREETKGDREKSFSQFAPIRSGILGIRGSWEGKKNSCLQRDPLEIRNKIDANPARLFPRSFREYSTGRTVNRSSGGGLGCFLVARRGTVSRTMRNGSPDGVQGRPCYFAWHRSSMKTRFVHRWTPLFSRPTELSVSRPMILFRWYTVDIWFKALGEMSLLRFGPFKDGMCPFWFASNYFPRTQDQSFFSIANSSSSFSLEIKRR